MIPKNVESEILQLATIFSEMRVKIELLEHENKLLQPQSSFDKLPNLLTTEEVAKYLRMSSSTTIANLFKISEECGGIEAFKMHDGKSGLMCTKEALKRFLDRKIALNRTNPEGGKTA